MESPSLKLTARPLEYYFPIGEAYFQGLRWFQGGYNLLGYYRKFKGGIKKPSVQGRKKNSESFPDSKHLNTRSPPPKKKKYYQ